ncbi:GNAT family N-acetyltransferase [Intrasporangium sp. YIM S08009]|uniref:GNAT family N-acetyltransferase n=1 Tax=Intrasporangium zincisolvens TaxID=3080018 RepID=UPI002B05941C|nr:GNAT family N-acetyltransferase [Intrasporangium sp. YIM S08009]
MNLAEPHVGPHVGWSVELADVGADVSLEILRDYLVDVADRWFLLHEGRRSTPEEIEEAWQGMPCDDLAAPTGAFVVARDASGHLGGCVGVRLVDPAPTGVGEGRVSELKRMFVRPEGRGTGLAPRLLAAAEDAARALGATTIRLDTRLDLVEARALYARHGYDEVPCFTVDDPYAEVWYAKPLT